MNSIIPFNFNNTDIRVIQDENGEPWFFAQDLAETLGYSSTGAMNKIIEQDERKIKTFQNGTTYTKQSLISESGLYSAIFGSTKQEAKAFKRWITHEVLPSIRKTGSYGIQAIDFNNPHQVAGLLAQSLEKVQGQQKVIATQEEKIKEDEPKVNFHDTVTASEDAISIAKAAKIIGTGRNRLLAFLRKIGWVTTRNEPYQSKIKSGHMDVKLGEWDRPGQGLQQSVTALITGKGLCKLQQIYGNPVET